MTVTPVLRIYNVGTYRRRPVIRGTRNVPKTRHRVVARVENATQHVSGVELTGATRYGRAYASKTIGGVFTYARFVVRSDYIRTSNNDNNNTLSRVCVYFIPADDGLNALNDDDDDDGGDDGVQPILENVRSDVINITCFMYC